MGDSRHHAMPSTASLVTAGALSLVALVAVGRAWVSLFGRHLATRRDRVQVSGGFYASQLSKYLPAGGMVQAASQVNMAAAAGLPLGQVAIAWPVAALCSVIAACVLGAGLVSATELSGWVRVLAACGLAAPVLLWRAVMATALRRARRIVPRLPAVERLPAQADVVRCFGWALIGLAAFCAAFTVLLRSEQSNLAPLALLSAYAISWMVGFLCVPVPAGVGVREAVLLTLVPGVGAGPLLAASLALRLLAIGTEILAIVASRILLRRHRSTGSSGAPRMSAAGTPGGP
jgi:glycosyltransferase 2 family protein